MLSCTSIPTVVYACSAVILYVITKVIYRLYFHPLSSIPGPKLAAATNLYSGYYDIIHGAHVKHYPSLHAKYGSVIRTQPNTIHVSAHEGYNQIFRVGAPFDRLWHDNPFLDGSLQSKETLPETKKRREFISPFFSKSAISRVEPVLHGRKLAQFLTTLANANGTVVNFYYAFHCLTADVVMDYCFRADLNALASPGFRNATLEAFVEGFDLAKVPEYFPNFFRALNSVIFALPDGLRKQWFPPIYGFQVMQNLARERVEDALSRADKVGSVRVNEEASSYTMFDSMARPDTARGQVRPSKRDMVGDGCLMIAAGSDTTANTLGTILWHVTQDSAVEGRLLEELRAQMGLEDVFTSAQLDGDGFEYLRAVIKEGLRLSYGVPGPIHRKVPKGGAQICGTFVPSGTTISATIYVQNMDPDTFPDPFVFDPERWLCDSETLKLREKQMVSFSRGSRGCIGMNLAIATLHLTTAHLFRRFRITTTGYTTHEDMDWNDRFVPVPKGKLKAMVKLRTD